jgi:hypothetical protein
VTSDLIKELHKLKKLLKFLPATVTKITNFFSTPLRAKEVWVF